MQTKITLSEMVGVVRDMDNAMEMHLFIDFVQRTLKMRLGVDVPAEKIGQVVGPIVPFGMHATPSNALHL